MSALGYGDRGRRSSVAPPPTCIVWLQSQGLDWVFPVYVAVLSAISVVLYLAARRSSGTYCGK